MTKEELEELQNLSTDSMYLDIADEDIDWARLANVIRSQAGVGSDSNLAKILGISKSLLSNWKNGKVSSLGIRVQTRMLELGGYVGLIKMLHFPLDAESKQRIEKRNAKVREEWQELCQLKPLPFPKPEELLRGRFNPSGIDWRQVKPLDIDLLTM